MCYVDCNIVYIFGATGYCSSQNTCIILLNIQNFFRLRIFISPVNRLSTGNGQNSHIIHLPFLYHSCKALKSIVNFISAGVR